MKARTFILATGFVLATVAPAAHANRAVNALACNTSKHAVSTVRPQAPFFSPLNPRGLQASTAPRNRASCASVKTVTVAPAHFQLVRNSL